MIGAVLRQARKDSSLSQAQLAERVFGDANRQGDISRIERGAVSPSVEMLERIADALDCELEVRFVPRGES